MTTHTGPLHQATLRRVVLFALLAVFPVIVVSTYLVAAFGPLHTHEMTPVAARPDAAPAGLGGHPAAELNPSHVHAHGGVERHWHVPGDVSVIVIDLGLPDSPFGPPAAESKAKASLPLAPPRALAFALGFDAADAWPPSPVMRWTSQSPPAPDRPPRA